MRNQFTTKGKAQAHGRRRLGLGSRSSSGRRPWPPPGKETARYADIIKEVSSAAVLCWTAGPTTLCTSLTDEILFFCEWMECAFASNDFHSESNKPNCQFRSNLNRNMYWSWVKICYFISVRRFGHGRAMPEHPTQVVNKAQQWRLIKIL